MAQVLRIAAVSLAGAILYLAGIVNSMVIYEPSRLGAVIVVIAMAASIALVVGALLRTSPEESGGVARSHEPQARPVIVRVAWGFICVMALVSLAWLSGVPRQRGFDWTPYHNDAIALNECAADQVLAGRTPYPHVDLFACYSERALGPDRTTPLRRGLFADVAIYPTDDQLDAVWALRSRGEGQNVEFVWRPSYPALSFIAIAPWVALGWDTNVLYLLCLGAAAVLIVRRTGPLLRPWMITGLLGATSLVAFTVGGSADLLYALPLVGAWLWRERGWSAVAYGIAAATKQIAWFFAPFLLIGWAAQHGWREAFRRAAIAAVTFAIANAPLAVPDPGAWLAGIVTPVIEPMFARGAGLVFLGINGVGPLLPNAAYLALEILAFAAAVAVAWRERRRSPELGIALAVVPLYFAHRSLFSYFFLLPLFAFAALARVPALGPAPEQARARGAVTLFAAPAERG